MAMPQCCYLAKGAKRPSHTTNMLTSSNKVQYILADILSDTNSHRIDRASNMLPNLSCASMFLGRILQVMLGNVRKIEHKSQMICKTLEKTVVRDKNN